MCHIAAADIGHVPQSYLELLARSTGNGTQRKISKHLLKPQEVCAWASENCTAVGSQVYEKSDDQKDRLAKVLKAAAAPIPFKS